jgi:hypothetical protein
MRQEARCDLESSLPVFFTNAQGLRPGPPGPRAEVIASRPTPHGLRISHRLSSRPELLIPQGDEKRSGGTCCFLPGAPDFVRREQKIMAAPLLASCARGGCMRRQKTGTENSAAGRTLPKELRGGDRPFR